MDENNNFEPSKHYSLKYEEFLRGKLINRGGKLSPKDSVEILNFALKDYPEDYCELIIQNILSIIEIRKKYTEHDLLSVKNRILKPRKNAQRPEKTLSLKDFSSKSLTEYRVQLKKELKEKNAFIVVPDSVYVNNMQLECFYNITAIEFLLALLRTKKRKFYITFFFHGDYLNNFIDWLIYCSSKLNSVYFQTCEQLRILQTPFTSLIKSEKLGEDYYFSFYNADIANPFLNELFEDLETNSIIYIKPLWIVRYNSILYPYEDLLGIRTIAFLLNEPGRRYSGQDIMKIIFNNYVKKMDYFRNLKNAIEVFKKKTLQQELGDNFLDFINESLQIESDLFSVEPSSKWIISLPHFIVSSMSKFELKK